MTTLISPASSKQLYWIKKLVDEKDINTDLRAEIKGYLANESGTITKKQAGLYLDILFDKNVKNIPTAGAVDKEGFYKFEEEVYRVVRGKQSGNLYAKLVTATGFDFAAGKGMMKILKASDLMTIDEIRAYGVATGICVNCSAHLSDPISIYIGLGTTCGPSLMGKAAYTTKKKEAKADPITAIAIAARQARKQGVEEGLFV